MPGLRGLIVATISGLLPALYFGLWFHWPTFLALAAGAVVAVVMLLVIASIGPDPAAEDLAWREAAPDLVRMPGESGPAEVPAGIPEAIPVLSGDASRDRARPGSNP
jgi:hypothetical protein